MDAYHRFPCPNPSCGKVLKALPAQAGKRARCSCGQSVIVPVPKIEPPPGEEEPLPLEPIRRTQSRLRHLPAIVAGASLALVLVVAILLVSRPWKHEAPESPQADAKTATTDSVPSKLQKKEEPNLTTTDSVPSKPKEKDEAKLTPVAGKQSSSPRLSAVAIRSAKTEPLLIEFSIELDAVQQTLPFEKGAGLWFCFGTPTTLPSLRSELEKSLKEDGDGRYSLNFRGPGFVAARCSSLKQDREKPERWNGSIDLGKANIQDGRIEIPSPLGSEYFPLTQMPISWVYHDGSRRLSNELKAIIDIKETKVVRLVDDKSPPKPVDSGTGGTRSAEKIRAATKLLGQGGDVKVEGFKSLESAKKLDLSSITRMVAEEDGLQKAARILADHDPAAFLIVLANARRPVQELTDILGPAEKTTKAEESLRIPEATEIAFQPKVMVTWHEYDWLAFAAVEGKIVAARVLPKKYVDSLKTGDPVADAPKTAKPSNSIWKVEKTSDGRTVLSDGEFSVTFPAGAKVETSGAYASANIEQKTGAKLDGYLTIERKNAPDDSKKAADPRKWLKSHVDQRLEEDRKSEYEGKKNYTDVRLIKASDITLGQFKGLKSITDHEKSGLGTIRIEGGYHRVEESDHYLIGNNLYVLSAWGAGAPTNRNAAVLFGDHTGFHRSDLAQDYLKSARLPK